MVSLKYQQAANWLRYDTHDSVLGLRFNSRLGKDLKFPAHQRETRFEDHAKNVLSGRDQRHWKYFPGNLHFAAIYSVNFDINS